MRCLPLVGLAFLVAPEAPAQTLTLKTSPPGATIYRVKANDNSLLPLGTGLAKFKLEDKDPNKVVVRLEGYRDVSQTFVKGDKFPDKEFTIFLTKRVVKVTALPYDAAIVVNGQSLGQRAAEFEVEEGHTATVEVKKAGFAPVTRVYRHERDGELPPLTDRFELTDRLVVVSTSPSGAEIFRDGGKVGDNSADVAVPQGACVAVRAEKPGWMPFERNYCNKEGLTPPPLEDRLVLAGRVVNLAAPAEARIFVNQKQAGIGAFSVKINDGSCAQVRIEQPGFLSDVREYCAQENAPAPPLDDVISLKPDESYSASVQSDQANVNITIEVGKGRNEEQAWKLVSSIVLSHFDILENSDRETGYLRTAWLIKAFADGAVIVRTRVIVKRTATDPLRYTVKIASERNRAPGISVKDDESFVPWERLLNTYKDVISEMQARLQ